MTSQWPMEWAPPRSRGAGAASKGQLGDGSAGLGFPRVGSIGGVGCGHFFLNRINPRRALQLAARKPASISCKLATP
jgi:hypothetical protein